MTEPKLTKAEVLYRQRTKTGILTQAEVAKIKFLLLQGAPKRQLKDAYGVSLWTIRAIARGDTWHWVEPDGSDLLGDFDLTPTISAVEAKEATESRRRMEELLTAKPEDAQFLTDGSKFGARSQSTQSDLDDLQKPEKDSHD